MLDKIFNLKKKKTNVLTEVMAGITTFMAMSYIIFINPLYGGFLSAVVFVATFVKTKKFLCDMFKIEKIKVFKKIYYSFYLFFLVLYTTFEFAPFVSILAAERVLNKTGSSEDISKDVSNMAYFDIKNKKIHVAIFSKLNFQSGQNYELLTEISASLNSDLCQLISKTVPICNIFI